VDDHSEDSTAAVAEAEGCVVLRSEKPPGNWVGKPWACWQGANKATGNLLVFLDADTFLEPDGLSRILYEYREKRGFCPFSPFIRWKRAMRGIRLLQHRGYGRNETPLQSWGIRSSH
jgi:4,4'-diaponeurosporenoate glycosyltransferase